MTFPVDLFPFRFAFNRDMVVTEVGSSLVKLAANFRMGADVRELVQLSEDATPFTYGQLLELVGESVEVVIRGVDARMRCQFVMSGRDLMGLGSPRFNSIEAFEASDLSIHDFAPHDSTVDTLLQRRRDDVPADDPRTDVPPLVSDHEQTRLAMVEQALLHDLDAAGDVVLRISSSDVIVEARASRNELLPCPPERLLGQNVFEGYLQLAAPLRKAVEQLRSTSGPVSFSYEVASNDGVRYCDARVTTSMHDEILLLAWDVTEQRCLKLQLERRATHDPLTDLANRTVFVERIDEALRMNSTIAVLFLDLDDFKSINDRHGHSLGDQLLLHVAETLRACIRSSDMAARLSGDEFAILLTDIDSKRAAEMIAQRLIDRLMVPARIGHRKMSVSVSVGIATNYDARDSATLMQFADVAMYQAKADSKCCFVSFRPSMYEDRVRRETIQTQLVTAGDQGQLINYYRPIVDIVTGDIRGLEALVRWQHPVRGLLHPDEFLESAEQSDAIVRLGEQTLHNICEDTRGCLSDEAMPPGIHFNVSLTQLKRSCLSSFIQKCAADNDFSAWQLTAEIEEETLQRDFNLVSREIEKLRDIGVRVAIDEFGAGNYSLAFLQRLPANYVKLAKPFVQQLGECTRQNQLVRAVIQLAQGLGLTVIATGVESAVQQELLVEFGCTMGQGDFYWPAVAGSQVSEIDTRVADLGDVQAV